MVVPVFRADDGSRPRFDELSAVEVKGADGVRGGGQRRNAMEEEEEGHEATTSKIK